MANAKIISTTLSTLSTEPTRTMACSDETDADLKQFLHLRYQFLVGDKYDHVVLGLNHGVVMRHDDFLPTHDGADARPLGQVDVLDFSPDHRSGLGIAVD